MPRPSPRPVPWDIYQEHLDEAAFCWRAWEAALRAGHFTPREIVDGPEERLAAHLDALVIGGRPAAERLLLPALEDASPERVRVAAWVLLRAEDGDYFDAVLGVFAGAEPPVDRAFTRAFALAGHPALGERFGGLWTHARPDLRASLLEVMTAHDLSWVAARLPEALRSDHPALLIAALRAARLVPDPDRTFRPEVEYALSSPEEAVRDEAAGTALALGIPAGLEACRRAIRQGAPRRIVLALLATSPNPADHALVVERVTNRTARPDAVWALGFAGTVDTLDHLASLTGFDDVGRGAAEAFAAGTGLTIEGALRRPDEEDVDAVVDSDSPLPVLRPEDLLPRPAPEAVATWWRENRRRFSAPGRSVMGAPHGAKSLRRALRDGTMWRRSIIALELAAASRSPVAVRTDGWVRGQMSLLPSSAP